MVLIGIAGQAMHQYIQIAARLIKPRYERIEVLVAKCHLHAPAAVWPYTLLMHTPYVEPETGNDEITGLPDATDTVVIKVDMGMVGLVAINGIR